jgi:hypothetical protein
LQVLREEVSLVSVTLGIGTSCVSMCCSAVESCTFRWLMVVCSCDVHRIDVQRTLFDNFIVLAILKCDCYNGDL